jgi:hypothetical protein
MSYQKPELVIVDKVTRCVQSTIHKGCNYVDQPSNLATPNAYEADE